MEKRRNGMRRAPRRGRHSAPTEYSQGEGAGRLKTCFDTGAWASLLCVLPLLLGGCSGSPEQRPNIILCMADDQGWGDVGYRDHPVLKTPVMDEMAVTGLRFERFYAAAPVCSPTRGSVLTGRHPNRFGCFNWGYTLRPQEVTIAEALRDVGYATGHFGKWHVGPVHAGSPVSPGASGFDEWFSSPNFFENDPLMSHKGQVVETQGEGSRVVVDTALEFIRDAAARHQPFLAVIWFGSPHAPHEALESDRDLYQDQPEELQHFYGEITAMDRAVGYLRSRLRELGVAENTLLWYTSDNGALPVGSTGGLAGGKGNLQEGGIRVPSLLEWPKRIKQPRTIEVNCGTVDIYPTLMEIVGVDTPRQPEPLDGISLVPLIDGKMERRDKPLGFWVYPAPGIRTPSRPILEQLAQEQAIGRVSPSPEEDPGSIDGSYSEDDLPGTAAWLDGDLKLFRRWDDTGQPVFSLFDLSQDPREENDLSAQRPAIAKRMKAELEAWQKSVVQSLNGADY